MTHIGVVLCVIRFNHHPNVLQRIIVAFPSVPNYAGCLLGFTAQGFAVQVRSAARVIPPSAFFDLRAVACRIAIVVLILSAEFHSAMVLQ